MQPTYMCTLLSFLHLVPFTSTNTRAHTHISILMYPFLTPPHQQERISSCLHMYTFSMFLFLRHSPYPKLPDCHNNSSPSQSSLSLPLSFFSLSLHSDDVTLLFVWLKKKVSSHFPLYVSLKHHSSLSICVVTFTLSLHLFLPNRCELLYFFALSIFLFTPGIN